MENSSILGTANSLPLSLPVVSNAAFLTGSACNFSRVSAPAVSSAWLLPSNSGTSFQSLMGRAYLYQHSSTAMLSGVTSWHQVPRAPASYPRMEDAVGLQPPSQTFCLPQPPEFPNSYSSRTPNQSSTNFMALPPTQTYQFAVENQDPPLLPLEISDSHELLAFIGPLDQEEMPHSEDINLGTSSLNLEDQGTLENGIEYSSDFANLTALLGVIHFPKLFSFFKDLDQPGSPQIIKANDTRDIMVNQKQEKSSEIKGPADTVRKNKHKASEPPDGTPKAKMQAKHTQCLLEGENFSCTDADSHRDPVNRVMHSNSKAQKAASSRNSKARGHGQKKTKKSRENNSKKAEESKQAGNKVKAEEKPMVPKMKHKRNQPELSQETFKKPRSYLGMHMLESVQVFHALGKKNNKNFGLSSSRALGNSSSNKDPHPCPARKPWLQVKGPEKTQVRAQKPDISAAKECPSPSQHELPPPGKVKLVPLPFLSSEKPQPRPVYHRPQSLASRRPTVAYPAQPASTSSAQPRAINQSRPAPANTSLMCPAKPAQPAGSHSVHSGLITSTQPSVPQSAASRPAPYTTSSCTSVQRGPVSNLVNKLQSQPPKPQNRYLLQDFALQPIPWRRPNVPEPVISTPITEEQRPEREAMKKKVQRERENAAKYPLG
uniref:DUF4629 domain-containing protein n=1 Tax=Sciurus vulgaris TaxID=55149 RepID=A0A8D2DQC2_SCIVU